MTNEEAVKIINCLGWGYADGDIKKAVNMATNALKYDTALSPVEVTADRIWNTFKCPNCGETYGDDEHEVTTLRFCPHCGRPLKWRRNENGYQSGGDKKRHGLYHKRRWH